MIIQFNTDKNSTVSQKHGDSLKTFISEELNRFSEQITRLEVHLSDENGSKEGVNDKRCLIEARLEGLKPVAVTSHANSNDKAVEGAIDKLKTALNTIHGRLSDH